METRKHVLIICYNRGPSDTLQNSFTPESVKLRPEIDGSRNWIPEAKRNRMQVKVTAQLDGASDERRASHLSGR